MIELINVPFRGLKVAKLNPFLDNRGAFYKLFSKDIFENVLGDKEIKQINRSITYGKGSTRGLHYQLPPYAETKIISCLKGKVFDIALDIRKNSATFLQWYGLELSDQNGNMIIIPEGFAHGFQVLSNDAELIYFHTENYVPNAEGGIRTDDPLIDVHWPLMATNLSERDKNFELLKPNFKGITL